MNTMIDRRADAHGWLDQALEPVRATPGPTMDRLHERLVQAAADQQLVDVAYRTVDSPLGPLLLAASPKGLLRVAFASQDHDAVLVDLAARVSPRVLRAPARLDETARELEDYFAGRRSAFDLPLDLRLAEGFRQEVLKALVDIGYGQTQSYGSVAATVGHPKAARAVGTACRLNPIPVVVPCHRVVRADGAIGDYAGGSAAKRLLLDLEAA